MPLQYNPVDIPLARGIDTRSDSKVMEPTQLLDLQNAVFGKRGALTKRLGSTALPLDVYGSATNLSAARALSKRGSELLLADASRVLSFADTIDAWSSKGTYYGWGCTVSPLAGTDANTSIVRPSTATLNNITVAAWSTSATGAGTTGSIFYAVYDETGGQILSKTTLATGAVGPWVVAVSSAILIFYFASANNLTVKVINTASVESSISAAAIASGYSDFTVTRNSACDIVTVGSNAFFAYRIAGATPQDLRVGYVNSAGTFGTTALRATGDVGDSNGSINSQVGAFANSTGSQITVLYFRNTGTRLGYIMLDAALAQTAQGNVDSGADTDIGEVTGIWATDDATWHALWEHQSDNTIYQATHDTTGTQTVVPAVKLVNAELLTHAFQFDSALFYHARATNTGTSSGQIDQRTGFCVAQADHKPVGVLLPSNLRGQQANQVSKLMHHPQVASTTAYTSVVSDAGIHQVVYSSGANHGYSSAEFNGSTYWGGAMLWECNGTNIHEQGFLLSPNLITSSHFTHGTTGSLTQLATYSYYIVYESENDRGQRVQSFGNVVTRTLTGSDDSIVITIPSLGFTRRSSVTMVVYRTLANGSIFYREGTATNSATAPTVSYSSLLSDDDISSNEIASVSQGEIENAPAPSLRCLTAGTDRLWGISNENRRRAYYTKLVDNDGGVETNDGYYNEFPSDLIGLGLQGGTTYALTSDAVYAVSGEGPDNTGSGGSFSSPVRIALGVGCSDPRTVVETPKGLAFLSNKGFWLIGPEGLRSIGDGVEDYWTQTFTSAVVLPGTNRVRWTTSSGRSLDWDYEFDQWSTHTSLTGVGSVTLGGSFYRVSSAGQVYKETTPYTDGGSSILIVAKTAWIRPTGSAHANSRATHGYLLGRDCGDGHSVTIEVAYDYDDTFTTVGTFAATSFPHIRFRLPRISFRAIMFRVTEVADGSPGEGIELSALGLELATEGTTGGRLLDS
jgi:hypothetical protein